NNYSLISIRDFKNHLKSCSEFKIYREGHTVAGRLPNCEDFIKLSYSFSANEIVRDEDVEKLVQYKNLIETNIKEIWGNFDYYLDNLISKNFTLDSPYLSIETYKKIT
ncbi:hypothetical protein GPA19_25910, partial [Azoarcus indigens]|nr:hypothetical protein [Azoarcus indigens]